MREVKLPVQVGTLVEGRGGRRRRHVVAQDLRRPHPRRERHARPAARGSLRKLECPGEESPKVHRLLEPKESRASTCSSSAAATARSSALSLSDAQCCLRGHQLPQGAFARCRAENRRRIDGAIAIGAVQALMPSRSRVKTTRFTWKIRGTRSAPERLHYRADRRHGSSELLRSSESGRQEVRRGLAHMTLDRVLVLFIGGALVAALSGLACGAPSWTSTRRRKRDQRLHSLPTSAYQAAVNPKHEGVFDQTCDDCHVSKKAWAPIPPVHELDAIAQRSA